MQSQDTVNPNIRGLLLVLLALGLLVVYAVPALTTGNVFWFWPSTGANPSQIVTYREGTSTVHRPGTPGYRVLAPLIDKALASISGVDDSGLSDVRVRELRSRGSAIEIYYAEPITIPTSFPVIKPNQILIPLDDVAAQTGDAYLGSDGQYYAGGLRIRTVWGEIRAAYLRVAPAPTK